MGLAGKLSASKKTNGVEVHFIKSWPEFFSQTLAGNKNFEIRFNDRNFQIGDTIVIEEFCNDTQAYSGRRAVAEVTCVIDFQQKKGFVVIGHTKPFFMVWKRSENKNITTI